LRQSTGIDAEHLAGLIDRFLAPHRRQEPRVVTARIEAGGIQFDRAFELAFGRRPIPVVPLMRNDENDVGVEVGPVDLQGAQRQLARLGRGVFRRQDPVVLVDVVVTQGAVRACVVRVESDRLREITDALVEAVAGRSVVRAATGFTLTRSIFAQGQLTTVSYGGASNGETLDYILSLETASLGSGQHIIQGDPAFVDPAGGDFHLRANSLAIDVAPAGDAADRDLDGLPRDIDLANAPNGEGPRDLGAYELQSAFPDCGASDTIMCNGLELIP